MINLLGLLLLNSLVCFGFWNACMYENTGEIEYINGKIHYKYNKGVLWRLDKWARDKWFYKPLCGCVPCMASLHSTYVYFTFLYVTDQMVLGYFLIYPIYIIALSGVNYLIER